MFHQPIIDYTTMPPGKRTRQGVITVCERCSRYGAYTCMPLPSGHAGQTERWLHVEQTGLLTGGFEDVCIRTTSVVGGETISEWSWKSLG
ncbi:MAG TPA: hypothetical protein VKQ36_16575 [Ktedonobacterales bacterium]|nr:hypothetical protein [Ktedonobacterales bacterium]